MENIKQKEINKLIILENIVWVLFIVSSVFFMSFLLASIIVTPLLLETKTLVTIYTTGGITTMCLPAVIILGRKIDKLKKENEVNKNGL